MERSRENGSMGDSNRRLRGQGARHPRGGRGRLCRVRRALQADERYPPGAMTTKVQPSASARSTYPAGADVACRKLSSRCAQALRLSAGAERAANRRCSMIAGFVTPTADRSSSTPASHPAREGPRRGVSGVRLFPWRTARQNVEFGRSCGRLRRRSGSRSRALSRHGGLAGTRRSIA